MEDKLENYYNYLKRLHAISHRDIVLLSSDGKELFRISSLHDNKVQESLITECLGEFCSIAVSSEELVSLKVTSLELLSQGLLYHSSHDISTDEDKLLQLKKLQ